MPIDPNQKKPQDPNAPAVAEPTPAPKPAPQAAAPQPARPTNPPMPGTGPNGPTNPAATPTPQNPQQQVQGSGYVGAQRYMDLLGPAFQQQAQARAQAAGAGAAQTQQLMQKATQSAMGQQDTAVIGDPRDVKKFQYQAPATLKDQFAAPGGAGEKEYDQMVSDAARYGDEAGTMGTDAGLSAYLQSNGVPQGAMSDYDAAMLGMATTGFQDNARRYGDLLGSLTKSEKAVADNYAKRKGESESEQAGMLKKADDAKHAKTRAAQKAQGKRMKDREVGGGKKADVRDRKENMGYEKH